MAVHVVVTVNMVIVQFMVTVHLVVVVVVTVHLIVVVVVP